MKDFPRRLAPRQPNSGCLVGSYFYATLALGLLLFATPCLRPQTESDSFRPAPVDRQFSRTASLSKFAAIRSLRIVQEEDGPAVEILSSKPLVPSIKAVTAPDRIVIDLPNATLETQAKRINIEADEITTLRAEQFQQDPPVARVVVDLLAPRAYSWDAAGNRTVVHLGKNPTQANGSPFEAPTVPSLTPGPKPVVAAVRAAGPLTMAAKDGDGGSGSTIAAGAETSILSLSSGGELHVCPGTTVAVTPSQNRHNLMFSMNTGALEAHFALDASSDSVITPDFRILLLGPGEFHYAISADNQGNTCVRALPGNTASAMVSELIGDRTYQVKATDQLVFRSGQLDRVDMSVPLECGCPPAREAPLRATNSLPALNPSRDPMSANASALNPSAAAQEKEKEEATATSAAQDPSATPNQLHVQLEVPFVFHATGPPPAPVEDVRALPIDARPLTIPALVAPAAPGANQPSDGAATESANHPPERGFFRKLGGFFAALFR